MLLLLLSVFSGQSFMANASPLPAWDFEGRAATQEARGDVEALAEAIVLRRGLGQLEKASHDLGKLWVAMAQTPLRSPLTAARLLDQVLDRDVWSDASAWESAMRRFLALLPIHTAPSARLRAEVLLAAQLWQQSCPIRGDDGACIQRFNPAKEARGRDETHCREPGFRYVVFGRQAALAAQAQQLAAVALRRAETLPRSARGAGDAVDEAVAHALYLRAEPHFEAALSRRRDKRPFINDYQIQAWVRSRFEEQRVPSPRGFPEFHLYAKVFEHPDSMWATAALARVSQLLLDMLNKSIGIFPSIPSPPSSIRGLARQQWAALFREGYCDSLEHWQPSYRVGGILHECALEASGRLLDDSYTRFCREARQRLEPGLFHGDEETPEIHLRSGLELMVNPKMVPIDF